MTYDKSTLVDLAISKSVAEMEKMDVEKELEKIKPYMENLNDMQNLNLIIALGTISLAKENPNLVKEHMKNVWKMHSGNNESNK